MFEQIPLIYIERKMAVIHEELVRIFLSESVIVSPYTVTALMRKNHALEAKIDTEHINGDLGREVTVINNSYIEFYFDGEFYRLESRDGSFVALNKGDEIEIVGDNCCVKIRI